MVRFLFPRIYVHLLVGLMCPFLAGCGQPAGIQSVEDFDDTNFICHRAKIFVMGLDYILRSSEFERTDSAFQDLGECIGELRKAEWGNQEDNRKKLVELSSRVKALLKQKPPNAAEARPIVDEMMKISATLPGDEPFLEGSWVNLKKL